MEKLKPRLPIESKQGFRGNFSGTPRFVTDGHVLILRSAVLDDVEIPEDKNMPLLTEGQVLACWDSSVRNPSRPAFFVGCCMTNQKVPLALVSDGKDYIFIDPYKLSFVVQATVAYSIEAAKHNPRGRPIILMREGNPVALIMPMRASMAAVDRVDISHDRVRLEDALQIKAEA